MVTSENLSPNETVGCRIESVGCFGTVKFIGTLPNHPGTWYGIEWDDPSRGKHNGMVNGVQYYETRHPTSGSFVRREKLNFGRNLTEAIISKYGNEESEFVKKIHERRIQNLQKSIKAPFIEFVGFDKVSNIQSDFESLEIVCVQSNNVSSTGDPGELKSLFPNINQLDLSCNLLTSWEQIFDVCQQLSHLYWLNVSYNILAFSENCSHIFPNITVFICSNMNLTWTDVKKLSLIFPNINELAVSGNKITDLTIEEKHNFHNLEILNLENNPIGNWDEILKLRNIKSLHNLYLAGVGLDKIDFKTEEAKVDYFHNLTKLCITDNNISDWTSVSELNRLPNLEELRFRNNPILNVENFETTTAIVIAKIGSLKIHNGRRLGEAGGEFKRGCEYDYMKKYGLEWLRVKNTPDQVEFLREHNRFLELINLYGELQAEELRKKDGSKLTNTLIKLNLIHNGQTITKKVSPTMLVQKLKILVKKLFKLDSEPRLLCDTENSFQIPLDDVMKELSYYSVQDNDRIFVNI